MELTPENTRSYVERHEAFREDFPIREGWHVEMSISPLKDEFGDLNDQLMSERAEIDGVSSRGYVRFVASLVKGFGDDRQVYETASTIRGIRLDKDYEAGETGAKSRLLYHLGYRYEKEGDFFVDPDLAYDLELARTQDVGFRRTSAAPTPASTGASAAALAIAATPAAGEGVPEVERREAKVTPKEEAKAESQGADAEGQETESSTGDISEQTESSMEVSVEEKELVIGSPVTKDATTQAAPSKGGRVVAAKPKQLEMLTRQIQRVAKVAGIAADSIPPFSNVDEAKKVLLDINSSQRASKKAKAS